MANKVEFGLKNVYYALMTADTPTYSAPVAIPGAVNFTPSPEGDLTKFYADDVAYDVRSSNNGYSAEIEFAKLPDAALAALLGWEVDDNGGLAEITDAEPPEFALLCEFTGDAAGRRVVYYNCKAARSKEDHPTKGEKVEPATGSLTLMISPIEIDGRMMSKFAMERTLANAATYDAWYTAVVQPTFSVS